MPIQCGVMNSLFMNTTGGREGGEDRPLADAFARPPKLAGPWQTLQQIHLSKSSLFRGERSISAHPTSLPCL